MDIESLLGEESNRVCTLGIWGIGGIGKTTIAKVIFNKISHLFEGSHCILNVREELEKAGGLANLRRELFSALLEDKNENIGSNFKKTQLSRRNVLVVFDDVTSSDQIKDLMEGFDGFMKGSRVIITARDKQVLNNYGVDQIYEVKALSDDDSLKLFSQHAFKQNYPKAEYTELSDSIVEYVKGIPLALKILGRSLFGKSREYWESTINELRRGPNGDIQRVLRISYEWLDRYQRNIFLDIACFFKGKDIDFVTKFLDASGFFPVKGISDLVDKALLVVSYNRVTMHDLLQEMGKEIVRQEYEKYPGQRSRLWHHEDIYKVLTNNTGTEAIECIALDMTKIKEIDLNPSTLTKMYRLRFLKFYSFNGENKIKLLHFQGLESVFSELRYFHWHGYPLKSLPSDISAKNLISFQMPQSNIEQLRIGVQPLGNLKHRNVSNSQNLIKTPDFTGVPNLEKLILIECKRLHKVHQSLLVHKKLEVLNLKDCTSLTTLPSKIHMPYLKKLVLSGCSKLGKFPEVVGSMVHLSELLLDGTSINELPSSVKLLSGLTFLYLKDCKCLVRLPSTINGLKTLKTLSLSGCSKFENVPENLGEVRSLEELDISGTAIIKPASCIFQLKNLKSLSFRGCKASPTSTSWFSLLNINLMPRRSSDLMGLVLPSLSGLSSLTKLDLSDCNLGDGAIPNDICNLLSLRSLDLSRNNFVSLPGTLNRLSNLYYLELEGCKRLQSLQFPWRVRSVRVDGCTSLERVSYAVNSLNLVFLIFSSANYLKLLGNDNGASSILKDFFETRARSNDSDLPLHRRFVVPGSKIPEWFKYQNEGSTIKIIDPDYYYENKSTKALGGYAICCVFCVHKTRMPRYDGLPWDWWQKDRYNWVPWRMQRHNCLPWRVKSDTHNEESAVNIPVLRESLSEHIALSFWSRCPYNWEVRNFEVSWGPGNDNVPGFEWEETEFEVKSCGVHPVYFEFDEEVFKTTFVWGNIESCNINESHQVFVESTMDIPTTSKLSLTEYAEANVADEDSRPNKRFKEVE